MIYNFSSATWDTLFCRGADGVTETLMCLFHIRWQAASKERLKSRHPFVPTSSKLLRNLSELGIRAVQWTNLTSVSIFLSTKLIGMNLTRTAWVKLNCLRTGVGRFGSSMHKWGLAPLAKCE